MGSSPAVEPGGRSTLGSIARIERGARRIPRGRPGAWQPYKDQLQSQMMIGYRPPARTYCEAFAGRDRSLDYGRCDLKELIGDFKKGAVCALACKAGRPDLEQASQETEIQKTDSWKPRGSVDKAVASREAPHQ